MTTKPRDQFASRGRRLSWVWIAVLVLAIALLVVPMPPLWVERYYSSSVYLRLQRLLTPLADAVPFALFDVWLAGVLMGVIAVSVRSRRRADHRRLAVLGRIGLGLAVLAGVLYLWFMLAWGLNYRRVPLTSRLDFNRARIKPEAASELAEQTIDSLNRLHPQAWNLAWPDDHRLATVLAPSFDRTQRELGGLLLARPAKAKPTLLAPYFRWASIDGMTDPFFLEVLLNPEVLQVERPFLLAHEWGHLAGLGHEAEASYFGWRLCVGSDVQAQYSAALFVYGHVMGAVDPATRDRLIARLNEGPRGDLRAIAAREARAHPTVRRGAWVAYDRFLRTNRVAEGVASYGAVLDLILGTNR
jgi:Protein of unknown function (DUF3810)